MKSMEDMEVNVLCNGNHEKYVKAVSSGEVYDVLRYAMAVSHFAQENLAQDQVLFIGGLGVLGNLVDLLGEEVIPKWRRTHDLDLVLRDRKYEGVIRGFFDELDTYCHSSSIRNKLTAKGRSFDAANSFLEQATIDVSYPGGNPKGGVDIQGQIIDSSYWDRSLVPSFFGIPMRVLDPVDLIGLKMRVVGKNSGNPRQQDVQDIYHLLAISQKKGYSLQDISKRICPKLMRRLQRLEPFLKRTEGFRPAMRVDLDYLEGLQR